MTPVDVRERLASQIRNGFDRFYKGDSLHPDAHLYWSIYTSVRLLKTGIPNYILGGSFGWPRVEQSVDTPNSHFSVEWGGGVWTENGEPHVHSWVVIPEHREIVDMTTLFVPERCQHQERLGWFYNLPPKHLWVTKEELRKKYTGAVYIPVPDATNYVKKRVEEIYSKEIQHQL